MAIVAYNQTTGSLQLDEISAPSGILPASGSGGVILTDFNEIFEIQADDQLRNYITASWVLLDVGTGLLTLSESLAILDAATGSAFGNNFSNIGSGNGIFQNKNILNVNFRSLTASGSVSVVSGSDTINISSSAVMSGSNTGSGMGVFDRLSQTNLIFRSLSGSGGISVSMSGSVSGTIVVSGSSNITNVTTGLKEPVKFATTGNVGLFGTSSVDTSGSLSQYAVSSGDRILVKNQLTSSQNGVYMASTGSWARSLDYDSGDELTDGTLIWVSHGYRQRSSQWVLTTNGTSSVVVDTTPLRYTQINSIENIETIPFPESRTGGNSTRAAQQFYEGGSYFLVQPTRLNRVAVRITNVSNSPTLVMMLMQSPNGNAGPARRVGTISASVSSTGVQEFSLQEGEILLEQGLFYVLWGKSTPNPNNLTMRTYVIQNLDLIVTTMPSNLHKTVFTTTIPTNSFVNEFNPATEANEVVTDIIPIIRLFNT